MCIANKQMHDKHKDQPPPPFPSYKTALPSEAERIKQAKREQQ